ncbi:MAG: polysaccharide biosynthesis protein [Clostridia bacterium]|nr:polysaccharide biosynthesis protein [Clostridia bacterium]
MKRVIFIKNAAVLTVTALILRLAGIIFKVWLAKAVGSEGIGLYQLTLSVYVLFSTFASGGISTAVTRLVADELALGTPQGAKAILKKGILLSLLISAVSLIISFFGADFIANNLLSDSRAAAAIRILGFSLPFMGVSSCLRGYFMARRKTLSSSISQVVEQAARILIVVFLSSAFLSRGISYACAAVFLGDTVAEGLSFLYIYLSYLLDRRKIRSSGEKPLPHGIRKIISIAAPITGGRYLNSLLRTIENILVPKALSIFGGAGLSQFGMIKGMALPLIFFPSSFLNSVSTLLIPEMSEALSLGQKYKIRYIAEKVITITFVSSFLLAGLFFILANQLGALIYGERDVGFLLRALSPLVPLMYIDSVCDGMLKGLDKQSFVFRLSVFDSASRIGLIWIFVPSFGMRGFLIVMVISNLLTAVWRVVKVVKIAELPFNIQKWVLKPFVFAVFSCLPSAVLCGSLPLSVFGQVLLAASVSGVLYIALVFIGGCLSSDDLRDIIKK